MATRPYIQKTAEQLSALFEQHKHDASELRKLSAELKHRSTPSARRLRKKVEAALKEQDRGQNETREERGQTKAETETAASEPRLLKCKGCATTLRIPVKPGKNNYTCPKCGTTFETHYQGGVFEVVFALEDDSVPANHPSGEMTVEYACEILGLTWPATLDQIKMAWRRQSQQYHPDKHQHLPERLRKAAEDEAKRINSAWNLLKANV